MQETYSISNENQWKFSRIIHKNKISARNKKFFNYFMIFIKYAIIIAYVVMTLYPFLYSLFSSFKGINEFNDYKNASFLPKKWTTESYQKLFNNQFIGDSSLTWIKNSIFYSISNSIINLVFNFLSGYALAKIAFRGRNLFVWYLLLIFLIPQQLTLYPTYFIMSKLNMLPNNNNIIWFMSILFSSCVNLYLTFMVRQFFMSSSSKVDEAGIVDGLSKTGAFFRISLRLMLPLAATQFMLIFTWSWNNFIAFTLYAGGNVDRMTVVVGLSKIASAYMDPYREIKIIAASNISFVPVIVVYVISLQFQKRGEIDGEK